MKMHLLSKELSRCKTHMPIASFSFYALYVVWFGSQPCHMIVWEILKLLCLLFVQVHFLLEHVYLVLADCSLGDRVRQVLLYVVKLESVVSTVNRVSKRHKNLCIKKKTKPSKTTQTLDILEMDIRLCHLTFKKCRVLSISFFKGEVLVSSIVSSVSAYRAFVAGKSPLVRPQTTAFFS